jgi:hypothetical protein
LDFYGEYLVDDLQDNRRRLFFSFAMAKASGQVQVTFGVTAANNACTRRLGLCAFSGSFRGLELIPLKSRYLSPPSRR